MRALSSLAMGALLCAAVAVGIADAYNNGLGALPPKGWNTWCTYDICGAIDKCSDAEVRQQALALVTTGLKDQGYDYVNMDDCWSAKDRDADGNLQPNAERFPQGMKALADYVHSLGVKIGVYTCVGTRTCRNGLPGSFGHFEQDARQLASWGIDFVKADNCARPGGYSEVELYSNFSRALNATGRPILFSLCEWGVDDVLQWGHTLGQMFRVQMDHLPLYNLPLPLAAGQGFGQGTKNIIDYVATIKPSTFVRQFGWLDPDFLMTLFWPTMTERYSRVELTFWSAWSAPMIVATQISNMTAEKHALLSNAEMLAINNDATYTGADMTKNMSNGAVQLWSRPLANGDAVFIVANLNDYLWHEPGFDVAVNWTDFGLGAGQSVAAVRDVWEQRSLGPAEFSNTSYATFLNATEVRYFRVTCANPPCTLVGR